MGFGTVGQDFSLCARMCAFAHPNNSQLELNNLTLQPSNKLGIMHITFCPPQAMTHGMSIIACHWRWHCQPGGGETAAEQ